MSLFSFHLCLVDECNEKLNSKHLAVGKPLTLVRVF